MQKSWEITQQKKYEEKELGSFWENIAIGFAGAIAFYLLIIIIN